MRGAQDRAGSHVRRAPRARSIKAKRLLGWVGRGVWGALLLCVGLLAVLLIRESAARKRYRAAYPPPGTMVRLDTHALHVHCLGAGNPTVVFESDVDPLGSLSWARVQGEVSAFTQACSYDRAGIMWSEPGPRPREGGTIARELGAALEAAGQEGPFVLVGHAFGGAYVRIWAGQDPDAVCGMVLVDSSHPDQFARLSAGAGIDKEIPEKRLRPLILLFSHLGMPGRFKGPRYSMSQHVYETQQAFLPKSSMAWFDESVAAPDTLAQAGQVQDLGEMPLIVLASARPATVSFQGRDAQETWLALQQELALLSKTSEIELLPGSGHYIQFDQPQVVVEAIHRVVQACRSGPTP